MSDPRLGLTATHRRYVSSQHTHYAGHRIDHSFVMELLSDAAAEVCIRTDGDEGAIVGFDEIDFLAPVFAGDIVEVEASVAAVGSTSRELTMEARVVCRRAEHLDANSKLPQTATYALEQPLVVARATSTVVVANPMETMPEPWGHQVSEIPERIESEARAGLRDLQETWMRWTRDAREQLQRRSAERRHLTEQGEDHETDVPGTPEEK